MYPGECGDPGRTQPKALTSSGKREAVQVMAEGHGMSIKHACEVVRLPRATFYKPGKRSSERDQEVIDVLNQIVATELRWGFWKCFDRLRQMGHRWNHKRVHRVYCALGLNQKRRTKRRLPNRPRQPLQAPSQVNVTWALDFMHDSLYGRRTFRTLNVLDEADRSCLGIEIATSIPSARVNCRVHPHGCVGWFTSNQGRVTLVASSP